MCAGVHNLCLTLTPEIIMKPNELPPLDYLNANLWYDPRTGLLWWKTQNKSRKMHRPAGCLAGDGYTTMALTNKRFAAHRICWALYHQQAPDVYSVVDHLNGTRSDNRIVNLRLTTQSENIINAKLQRNSTSGFRGVSWCKSRNSWEVSINHNRNRHYLGRFATLEEAITARLQAEKDLNVFHREQLM